MRAEVGRKKNKNKGKSLSANLKLSANVMTGLTVNGQSYCDCETCYYNYSEWSM